MLEREQVFAAATYDDPVRPNDLKMPARLLRSGDEPHVTVMGGDEYFSLKSTEPVFGNKIKLTMTSWGGDVDDVVDANYKIEIRGRKS